MKKILMFSILAVLMLFVLGCGKKKDTLYVYNWSYYIPDEVIKSFEKEYGIKVVYDVFSSNEEMYTKLKAGGTGYDIVFPSGDFAPILITEGLVEKIDKSKIENFKNIDPDFIKKATFDPGLQYSVPYMAGAVGISVNTKHVKDYPKDYSIYEMDQYKGKMTMLDDMREVIGNALAHFGYSVNSNNENELNEAKELCIKWKKNILKYDAESFGKGFANGEFWIVQGYSENVFLEADDELKPYIDFFIPEKGGTMYMDSMMMLKGAKNVESAYKFMNYIHRPEVYAQISDWLSLPAINVPARDLMKVTPNYTIDDMKNCEFKNDIGNAIQTYNKIWQEIVIEN